MLKGVVHRRSRGRHLRSFSLHGLGRPPYNGRPSRRVRVSIKGKKGYGFGSTVRLWGLFCDKRGRTRPEGQGGHDAAVELMLAAHYKMSIMSVQNRRRT